MGRPRRPTVQRPWLVHHDDEHRDHCVTIGSHLVCARCATIAATVVILHLLLLRIDVSPRLLLAGAALAVPAAVELASVMTGRVPYNRIRAMVLTAPACIPLVLLVRYLAALDLLVVGAASLALLTAIAARARSNPRLDVTSSYPLPYEGQAHR